MNFIKPIRLILPLLFLGCEKEVEEFEEEPLKNPVSEEPTDIHNYPGVPKSSIYEVTLISGNDKIDLAVFQSKCPQFQLGRQGMVEKDQYPLDIFEGRSINWTKFSLSGPIEVEVRILDQAKVPIGGDIRILPSRDGIVPSIEDDVIRFTLSNPGQFSLEIGDNGYKNGLMVFADPSESEIPDQNNGQYSILHSASVPEILSVAGTKAGLYFKSGVHNIGIFKVPHNIKNIYFEEGAWVYGALIIEGNSGVRIFGRGVLSAAKLNYREAHSIEAINQSNNIHIEGLVIADTKHFGIRLIGKDNLVKWTKIIGGWVYNTDGISAFEGSTVTDCFIWANDDSIKIYRDNNTWSDIVVWQLNNGGVIQMSWGGSQASNVSVKRIDVLHAEWNKPGFNRALLSCVGNRYKIPGKTSIQKNWIIEDVVTETAIPIIINITPDLYSPNLIHDITLRDWNVQMDMGSNFRNIIIGNDPNEPIDGFLFENFYFNGIKLGDSNWKEITDMYTENFETPNFK